MIFLISNWYKSKQVVCQLQQSSKLQFQLIGLLAFVYFIQAGIFILSLEKITFAPLLSLKGLQLIVFFLLSVAMWSFVFVYGATFAIWVGARCFNGNGTLLQTRPAIIWSMVHMSPAGFLMLIIYYTFIHPSTLSFLLRMGCYLGMLALIVYGFIVLVKTVSETQQFGLWRALFACVIGLSLMIVLVYAISINSLRK